MYQKFVEEMKAHRKKLNLSQEKVAEDLGVSRQTYSAWETTKNEMGLNFLFTFMKLYDFSIDKLVFAQNGSNEEAQQETTETSDGSALDESESVDQQDDVLEEMPIVEESNLDAFESRKEFQCIRTLFSFLCAVAMISICINLFFEVGSIYKIAGDTFLYATTAFYFAFLFTSPLKGDKKFSELIFPPKKEK